MVLASKLPKKSIAVLVGNNVKYASGAVFYDFQQNNDLYYLTGWLEPNSVAIIEKVRDNGNDDDVVLHMLVPESAPAQELWEGARSGTAGAYEVFNADETAPIDDFEMYVSKLIARNDYVYYDDPNKSSKSMFALYFSAPQPKYPMQRILDQHLKSVRSLTNLVARQRAVKSASEIAVMAKAGAASSLSLIHI